MITDSEVRELITELEDTEDNPILLSDGWWSAVRSIELMLREELEGVYKIKYSDDLEMLKLFSRDSLCNNAKEILIEMKSRRSN